MSSLASNARAMQRDLEPDPLLADLSREVRRCGRSRATRARIDTDEIAQALALDPRTVCQRLRADGTMFRSLVNRTRLGIAKQLLADTTMGLAEISAVLDFSEPGAFTHAFRRWTGMAPSAWRQDHQTTRPTS